MRAIIGSALLLLLGTGVVPASAKMQVDGAMVEQVGDEVLAQEIGAFAEELRAAAPNLPGLSAVVLCEDQVIATLHWGFAERESEVPASDETRWYIASATKTFVGTAFALLAEQGEIDLDWTLAELADDIDFAPGLKADQVTLRHLLSHTHGLSSGHIEYRLAYSGEHDPDTLWALLAALEPNPQAPLGTFRYGNLGYNIATILIERRLGRRWQDLVDAELLAPLSMTASLTQGLEQAREIHPFAYPYNGNHFAGAERLYLIKRDQTMQSAGGMYANTDDMGLWLRAQLSAARKTPSNPLLRAIRLAQTSVAALGSSFGPFERKAYGLGWYSGDYNGEVLHHAFGSFVGAMAHSSFMPKQDLAVAAMTNENGVGALAPHILAGFVYDWQTRGSEYAWGEGRERLAQLQSRLEAERSGMSARIALQAERAWDMSLPNAAYAGCYADPLRGTLRIVEQGEGLAVQMGALVAKAQAYTQPDSIRLELIPGRGQVGQFLIEGDAVIGFELNGVSFTRCD